MLIAFTLIFLVVLALDAYPGLRGGAGWRWPYALPESAIPVLILAVLIALYITLALYLRKTRLPDWVKLAFSVFSGAVIALAVVGVRGDAGFLLFTRTVSPVQTGASALAVRVMADGTKDGLQSTIERWPEVMREAGEANLIHFTTSPPGQALFHYATASAFQDRGLSLLLRPYQCSDLQVMQYTRGEINSVLLGMLMPLWAALAVIPIYFGAVLLLKPHPAYGGKGARLCAPTNHTDNVGTRHAVSPNAMSANPVSANAMPDNIALNIAQWWPLIPTVLLFAPTWNTLYPFLCVTVFVLLLAGMRHQSGWRFAALSIAAGVVMSVTTFLNFAVLPVLLLFGLFSLGYWFFVLERSGGLLWPVLVGLLFGIGLFSVWIVFWLASGLTPLDILQVTFDEHSELVQRDYLPWLILHPYDTLMFIGWPVTGLFLGGVWLARRHRQAVDVLAISMLLTLLLVNFSGIVQGENARILSFYAPFLLLGGLRMYQACRGVQQYAQYALFILQGLTVLVMAAVLPVVPLDLNPQPTAPRSDVSRLDGFEIRPVGEALTSTNYAGQVMLTDYRYVADPAAQAITLETIWQGDKQMERPYAFEVVAVGENAIDGEIRTEPFQWYAQGGNYLPTCWRNGDEIVDVTVVPLPPVSAPVVWTLELQLVDERTGDAMQPLILLGPIPYP